MKNVGEFEIRNSVFNEKFNRELIIQSSVHSEEPVIFDIGAHHGQSIEYLRGIFPSSIIYSFEPDPDSFKVLIKKESANNKLFNIALSDTTGEIIFYKNKISHTNSLFKVNLNSRDSIRAKKENFLENSSYLEEINLNISVKTTTLDQFVSDFSIKKIDLLKIDVQGAEELVLLGGVNALKDVTSIIVEVSFFDYYEKSTNFLDIEKILIPHGFSMFSILDISKNPMNGRTDWAEILYRK